MNALNRRRLKIASLISLVIAVVWTGAYAQTQPAPKENANVISGRITSDNQPLTKALVTIGKFSSNTSFGQSVRVDSEGNFATQALEPGLYFISVSVPGLIRDPSAPGANYLRPGDTVDYKMIKGGVITGTIKNANGDGLVGIPVRAFRVRMPNGDPISFTVATREMMSDDRGIYRLYGLPAGSYIVSAGGQSRLSPIAPSAYEGYVPTFASSATRDTATEIQVSIGSESQADIQFREERGHVISGIITRPTSTDGLQQYPAGVVVFDSRNRAEVATVTAVSMSNFSFAFYGMIDGDYEIYASQGSSTNEQMGSPPVRIKVQGADVTGLKLLLAPLASLDGRVTFENDPKAACGKHRASALVETMIFGRRYEPRSQSKANLAAEVPATARNTSRSAMVDGRGVFSIKNLQPGTYQIDPTAPASGWFVRSVQLDRNAAANVSRDGVSVKNGDHINGLTVTFAEGAAKLKGHLSAGEGQPLPLKLRVYLVPEEREAAGNLYRYYETAAERDGTFTLDNVAPGKYLMLARRAEENEMGITKFVRLDETLRTTVLKEAEAQKKAIAFKPCEQVADFDLPYLSPRL
jgi:hypothetical protein